MTTDDVSKNLITVGFDGSDASLAALRWAVTYARSESSTIQVVTSYLPHGGESIDVARMNAEAVVNRAAREEAKDAELTGVAIHGEPTEVLIKCSENSHLLVVGRHGTSGIIHSALGAVGDACARLALCPVVIVPPDSAAKA